MSKPTVNVTHSGTFEAANTTISTNRTDDHKIFSFSLHHYEIHTNSKISFLSKSDVVERLFKHGIKHAERQNFMK